MKKVLLVLIAGLCLCALFACVDVGPSYNVGEVGGGGNIGGGNVGGSGGASGGASDTDRDSDLILVYGDYVFYMEDKNLRLFKLDNGEITLIDSQELPFSGSEMLLSDEGVNVICWVSKEYFKDEEPDKTFYRSTVEIIVFDVPQDDEYKLEAKNQYSLCGSLRKAKTIDGKLYIAANVYGTIEEAIDNGFRFDIEELDPPAEVNAPQTQNSNGARSVFYCVSTLSAYTVYGSFVDFLVQDGKILSMHNFYDEDVATTMVVLYDETWEIKGSYYEEFYAVYDNFSLAVHGDYVYFVTYCRDKGTNFTVLSGENLEKVGEIRDLYTEAKPMSSIFIGEKFYFTRRIWNSQDWTYVNSLYIIDASEPTNPEVVYESKFDSYSLYLYAVDDSTMIMFRGAGIRLYSLQGAIKFKDSLYLDDLESQFFGGDTRMSFFDKPNGRIFVFTGLEIEKAYWDMLKEKYDNGDLSKEELLSAFLQEEGFIDEYKETIMNMRMTGSLYVIEYTDEDLKVVHKFEDLRTGKLFSDVRSSNIRCIVKDGYIYVLYSGVAYSFDATDFTEKCVLDYANNGTADGNENNDDSENKTDNGNEDNNGNDGENDGENNNEN